MADNYDRDRIVLSRLNSNESTLNGRRFDITIVDASEERDEMSYGTGDTYVVIVKHLLQKMSKSMKSLELRGMAAVSCPTRHLYLR